MTKQCMVLSQKIDLYNEVHTFPSCNTWVLRNVVNVYELYKRWLIIIVQRLNSLVYISKSSPNDVLDSLNVFLTNTKQSNTEVGLLQTTV